MSDLLATWLAGHFYGQGAIDQVYPADTELFTMLPPDLWDPLMQARGYDHDVFPFIYPPLWAWAAAPMASILAPEQLFVIARIVNPLLIGAMVWLAARATETRLPPVAYVAAGLVAAGLSGAGTYALSYGQPQILVAFLTVLAIERSQRGGPVAAGAAMGLAAAIKLYPVLYAVAWGIAGRLKALLTFSIAGGALGLLSIAVAGWPLHEVFLAQIRSIGETALLTGLNFSLDPLLSRYTAPDSFFFVLKDADAQDGWLIAPRGQVWSALSMGLTVTVIAVGGVVLKRTGDVLVWPIMMILISILSPLSWVYHYLAPLAFAPALLDRLGVRTGGIWLILTILPLTLPLLSAIDALALNALPVQGVALVCLLGLAAGFARAIRIRAT